MNTIPKILACALLASASSAFAHGSESHAATAATAHATLAATKEQKDWGIGGDPRQATRIIALNMGDDMRFSPAHFTVKKGETLRLRVVNQGQVMHEVVLGTKASLAQHAQMPRHGACRALHGPCGAAKKRGPGLALQPRRQF